MAVLASFNEKALMSSHRVICSWRRCALPGRRRSPHLSPFVLWSGHLTLSRRHRRYQDDSSCCRNSLQDLSTVTAMCSEFLVGSVVSKSSWSHWATNLSDGEPALVLVWYYHQPFFQSPCWLVLVCDMRNIKRSFFSCFVHQVRWIRCWWPSSLIFSHAQVVSREMQHHV
jgi:hypothetical protein